MTWLKEELDTIFEREGREFFSDPWVARDESVDIVDHEVGAVDGFLSRHLTGEQSASRRTAALKLLEMQRQGMLMQSSDGWFFDDISGPETVQILAHAARAVELAAGFGASLEDELLEFLRRAPGNHPAYLDGGAVYAALVRPMAVSTERLVAHYAIKSNSMSSPGVYSALIREQSRESASAGQHSLVTGRVQVHSMITEETHEGAYALLHFGGHEVHCAVRMGWSAQEYERVRADLHTRFGREILSAIIRRVDEAFGPAYFTLQDLMLEDRRRVLAALTVHTLTQVEEAYRRLFVEHRPLMQYLRDAKAEIPAPMLVAAVFVLTRDLERELAGSDLPLSANAVSLVTELQAWGREVLPERFEPLMRGRLEAALAGSGPPRERLFEAIRVLDLADAAGFPLNLWDAQNLFFQLVRNAPPSAADELRAVGARLHFNMDRILVDVRAG